MTIEKIPTDKLIPYARNAKKHDAAQVSKLAGSIREFGFNNPILIDSQNGIIAGHGRVLAAQQLGLADVPCIRLGHLTDTQRRAYILADNKLAEIGGGWDEEMLGLELADLRETDFDLGLLGFDARAIEDFLNPPEPYSEEAVVTGAGASMKESKENYDESIIRQIILIYPVEEYDAVIDAMGQYADQNGLANNTEVVNHLLETNGYAISQRQSKES